MHHAKISRYMVISSDVYQLFSRSGDEIEVIPECAELMFTPHSRRMTTSDSEIFCNVLASIFHVTFYTVLAMIR